MTFPLKGMCKSCGNLIAEAYRGLQLSLLAKSRDSCGALGGIFALLVPATLSNTCLSVCFQNHKFNQIDFSGTLSSWLVRKIMNKALGINDNGDVEDESDMAGCMEMDYEDKDNH